MNGGCRRVFCIGMMLMVLISPCAAHARQDATWLIVNEDNDHYFKCDSACMTEKSLVEYIDYVCQGPVTHFFMCPSGQRASFDSKTWEPIWKGMNDPDGSGAVSNIWCVNAKRLHDLGLDPYAVWIRRCRERRVAPWLSMRMNDTHGMNVRNFFRGTTFCRTRSDLWINPDGKTRYDYCLDFAKKDVRDYTMAHFRELVERYDVDGVEMDWMRMGRNLRYGHEKEDGHFLTEFMAEARKSLDEIGSRRGRRIALGVRTCRDPDLAWEKMGMAVADWAKAGLVDLVVPHSFWAADPGIAVGKWIQRIGAANPSVRVVPGIDFITLRNGKETAMTPGMYRWVAEKFYSEGAGGVYLFNLPYLGKYATDAYINKAKIVDYDVAEVIFREGLAPETVRSKPREAVEPLHDFPCW